MIERYALNAKGRDFVVGDIHGCFVQLNNLLDMVEFDPVAGDRLFSLGDLIDRGPASEDVMRWLSLPWFHAIRGNHEEMLIGVVDRKWEEYNYRMNGGAWILDRSKSEQKAVVKALRKLPYLIEIECAVGKVGLVHADPVDDVWDELVNAIGHEGMQASATWSRSRIQDNICTPVLGVDYVFCGHTILDRPQANGNVIYIDTGAFTGNMLTMVEISSKPMTFHMKTTEELQ